MIMPMLMPTARFLHLMALEKKCPGCGRYYLGVVESENEGACGRCMSIAFPIRMREEPVMREFISRKLPLGLWVSPRQ